MDIVLVQKLFSQTSEGIKASKDLCRVCSGGFDGYCHVFEKSVSDTIDIESVECPVNKACLMRLRSVWQKMSFEDIVEEAKLRG